MAGTSVFPPGSGRTPLSRHHQWPAPRSATRPRQHSTRGNSCVDAHARRHVRVAQSSNSKQGRSVPPRQREAPPTHAHRTHTTHLRRLKHAFQRLRQRCQPRGGVGGQRARQWDGGWGHRAVETAGRRSTLHGVKLPLQRGVRQGLVREPPQQPTPVHADAWYGWRDGGEGARARGRNQRKEQQAAVEHVCEVSSSQSRPAEEVDCVCGCCCLSDWASRFGRLELLRETNA